jgi:chromosome partitioning protein
LGGELKLFSETKALQQPFCLRNLVKALEELGFKYCVLDLSPAIGALERAALIAADEVITPVMPDVFGLDGLQIFASNLVTIREDMDTRKPIYKRIVVNAIDCRIQQHSTILRKIQEMGTAFSIYTIPVDQAFRKAQAAGMTIQALGKCKKETLAELNRITINIIEEGTEHGK